MYNDRPDPVFVEIAVTAYIPELMVSSHKMVADAVA
jgi:hypothetical protein